MFKLIELYSIRNVIHVYTANYIEIFTASVFKPTKSVKWQMERMQYSNLAALFRELE